jgi:hypothetical protein
MGAWGTGPFENDAAQDFFAGLKSARKAARLGKIEKALDDYLDVIARLRAGDNVRTTSDAEIAEIREVHASALRWYKDNGRRLPIEFAPQYASPEAFESWLAEVTKPQVIDGCSEASCAFAACGVIAAHFGDAKARRDGASVAMADAGDGTVLRKAIAALDAAFDHEALVASWSSHDWQTYSCELRAIRSALGAASPSEPGRIRACSSAS